MAARDSDVIRGRCVTSANTLDKDISLSLSLATVTVTN